MIMFDNIRAKMKLKKDFQYQLKIKESHIDRLNSIITNKDHTIKVLQNELSDNNDRVIYAEMMLGNSEKIFYEIMMQSTKYWQDAKNKYEESKRINQENQKQIINLSEKGIV